MRLILTATLAAFSLAQPIAAGAEAAAPAVTAPSAPAITVTPVTLRTLRDTAILSGLIGPVEQVLVAPQVEGQQIEALLADVGDSVQAGQVLARLSTASLTLQKSQLTASLAAARAAIAQSQAQMLEAQSAADEANRAAERTLKLKEQGSASQVAYDRATAAAVSGNARAAIAVQALESTKANLALVEAQLSNIDLSLSRTEVKAPVAGEITARNAQLGAIASAAGQPMFTLIRDNALELRADVAEGDLLRLAPGQTATLLLAGDTAPRSGTIRLVEPSIDTATRMGRARITLDDPESIRSGMFAEATVLVTERQGLAVPISAIGTTKGQPSVLKVTGDTATRVNVTTGIRAEGWVEILSGLAEGDLIVAKAGAFVRDGDRITPVLAN